MNLLFMFSLIVACRIWSVVSDVTGLRGLWDYESVASCWLGNKKHAVNNIISSAVLWFLWKFRNKLCFQGACWIGEREVLLGSPRF